MGITNLGLSVGRLRSLRSLDRLDMSVHVGANLVATQTVSSLNVFLLVSRASIDK